ncbi:hypothetical protein CCH79_00007760 [Gambusia affinis]|uniref:Receptor protein-tyrosine kinase n=1 Tax=Gambusia affinis TaxID=33528 RepID=A0A315W2C8_GAMAF|nr:hypothetical protein CCH79_00007760 [Gambusia affinis]
MKPLLLVVVVALRTLTGSCGSGVLFTKHPSNQTVSQGNEVRLGCAVEGLIEPDIIWMKDGEKLYSTDQVFLMLGEQHWETSHSVKSVQQQDAGQYWCEVESHSQMFASERAWITVEGVPHFIQEPQDVATFPSVPFNLSCAAVGPPDPVEVLWWLGGVQKGGPQESPSVLHVPGVNSSIKFYCEAKNARGISVSRTGTVHIKVLPAAPVDLQLLRITDNNVTLSWKPGFMGYSELSTCVIQVVRLSGRRWNLPQQEVQVPPHIHVLTGLRSHSNYSLRVSCSNEVGASPFSPWLTFITPESVPSVAPRNLSFELSGEKLSLQWARLKEDELQGKLLAYKLQWTHGGEPQEPLLFKENSTPLLDAARFFNASIQVAACTVVGCGPWSPPVLVMPASAPVQVQRSRMWVGLLLGLLVATIIGLLLTIAAQRREKETKFGSAFKAPGPESSVFFTAARSFSRNMADLQESTLDSLCISSELKNKLQDVLISERLLTLGHMLGKGEFGSVREAILKTDDSSMQKVAVKVYEIMHRCWSPVPKYRPSFPQLVAQLEALHLALSPVGPLKESLLYVNLEGDNSETDREEGAVGARILGLEAAAESSSWSVPWQRQAEDEEKDWLMVGSGAALAIGGDYRYIVGPCGAIAEEAEELGSVERRGDLANGPVDELRDEDDDVVIDV